MAEFFGRFKATLSDGRVITEKYPTEDQTLPSYKGWSELKEYLQRSNLHIVKMSLRLRNQEHYAPANAEDYFVNMQQVSVLNMSTQTCRGLGFKQDSKWFIVWFNVDGVVRNMEVRDV